MEALVNGGRTVGQRAKDFLMGSLDCLVESFRSHAGPRETGQAVPEGKGPPAHEAPQGPAPLSSSHISPQTQPEDERPRLDPDLPIITYAQGGKYAAVKIPGLPVVGGGKRSEVTGFSKGSRRRMLIKVNSVCRSDCKAGEFAFVTMTYHENIPTARATKRDLDVFIKRFEREWGPHWLLWKIEPQGRGAPHYHLLLRMGAGFDCDALNEWTARAWNEIAGADSVFHLGFHLGALGNRPCVEVVKDWDGLGRYAGKYLGKVTHGDEEWKHPGRYWGERRPDLAPIKIVQENVTEREGFILRRLCVKHLEHQPATRFYFSGKQRADGIHLPGFSMHQSETVNSKPIREQLERFACDLDRKVRPQPFRWRRSRGGCSGFILGDTFERYLKLAKQLAREGH